MGVMPVLNSISDGLRALHQLLGLKEALEVLHLPDASDDENKRLRYRPPKHTLVGALTCHAEPLLTILLNEIQTVTRTLKDKGKSSRYCEKTQTFHNMDLYGMFKYIFKILLSHML